MVIQNAVLKPSAFNFKEKKTKSSFKSLNKLVQIYIYSFTKQTINSINCPSISIFMVQKQNKTLSRIYLQEDRVGENQQQ